MVNIHSLTDIDNMFLIKVEWHMRDEKPVVIGCGSLMLKF